MGKYKYKFISVASLALWLSLSVAFAQESPQPKAEPSVNPEWFFPLPHFRPPFFYPHLPPFRFPFPFPFPSPHVPSHPSHPPKPAPPPSAALDDDTLMNNLQLDSLAAQGVSDEHIECVVVHHQAVVACYNDFHSYLMTHEISVSPKCCSAIERVEDVCQPLYNHPIPLLEGIITRYCSVPPPTSAPVPSPSSYF